MERTTAIRTNPPIYDERYKVVCPIESDCGAFEEQNCTCFECGVHEHIVKLAAYEDTGYTPEEIADLASRCNILDGHNKQLREIRDEYWQQIVALKAENERLRAKWDKAVADLTNYHNPCGSCIHRTRYSEEYPCRKCQHMEKNRYRSGFVSYFKWRGLEESTCG